MDTQKVKFHSTPQVHMGSESGGPRSGFPSPEIREILDGGIENHWR